MPFVAASAVGYIGCDGQRRIPCPILTSHGRAVNLMTTAVPILGIGRLGLLLEKACAFDEFD